MIRSDVPAVATLERMFSKPVVLHDEEQGKTLTVTPAQIADATVVTVAATTPASIDISLNSGKVAAILAPHRSEYELPAVDAGFDVDIETDTVFEIGLTPNRIDTRSWRDLASRHLAHLDTTS